jgi:hypothetical protein
VKAVTGSRWLTDHADLQEVKTEGLDLGDGGP